MGRRTNTGSPDAAMQSIASAFACPNGDTTTALSISGTAAAATGLVENATYRLWASVACFVRFAASGDADTGDMPMTAELAEWVTLQDLTRISAITSGATGTLYITRMG